MSSNIIAIEDLDLHRAAITGHCYRMLGSVFDAEDAAQDTFIRAWRARSKFDGRSSLRTWLYRIATNVCLDHLDSRSRRIRPTEVGGPCNSPTMSDLLTQPAETWIEPISDIEAIPSNEDPARRAILRETIRLAFVAALQHLPPKQRAVLLLNDVLDFSSAETASALSLSVAAVNSALQRARDTMAKPIDTTSHSLTASQSPGTNQFRLRSGEWFEKCITRFTDMESHCFFFMAALNPSRCSSQSCRNWLRPTK